MSRPLCRVSGVVVEGKHLGTSLGFPTANVQAATDAALPRGVFLATAAVGECRYAAIVNNGSHPTFPDGAPTVEAHLLGYQGSLYGSDMCLTYWLRLREEKRFAGAQALCDQLKKDKRRALRVAQRHPELRV